ncbi:MBL fold metallo-hydrolase [Boseongicola aestuarii]|uniref:Hydroxyacylglutathione hydrolase n=1 Tax=Boseongicola aestuarii TaxID=1470561 RepID=A0A238J3C2_9RHOB|nr:MBL fold metallo-hydrolase [Boseongicola aestuarii]SMX24665.1 Hydroxyacylglutathione hydrolase [Boseongicola aestuarii]
MAKLTRKLRYPFETPPPEGEVTEVVDGILWARLPLPMALDHVNVYILDGDDGWTIVDTGFNSRRTRAIWQKLLEGPLAGKPVARVLVTHHHPDHVGLAGWFVTEHGAELLMSRTAWLMARMLTLDEQAVPPPETMAFWKSAGMSAEILASRANERPFNFADAVAPIPLGYTRVTGDSRLVLGGRGWLVLEGNGHAPEHLTLWSEDSQVVLAGDQIIPSISPNIGVYATEPEADPLAEWLESCERFQTFATPGQLVLPGHKLPFIGTETRLDQLIQNHHGALQRLEAFLVEPHTAAECFRTLFKRDIPSGEYGLALVEAMAHCLHLWHDGRVTREMREDGVWAWQVRGDV